MVSISRSMSSRCLSTELVDGATALRFGEAFEGRHVELVFDLVGGDAVLLCEVEEVFDLLGGRRSIRGRAVPLTVIIKIICENLDYLKSFAIIIGNDPRQTVIKKDTDSKTTGSSN